jgi:hypothetical protein
MMESRGRVQLALLAILLGICLGCPGRTTIAAINRDPGRYSNRQITIAGRVTNSFGALGSGVFEVEDDTGRMWVLSQSYGVPSTGAKLAVTGRISQGFALGGRNFATILKETQRRH